MSTSAEWEALLERRRRHNSSGQDGCDFEQWKTSRGAKEVPHQPEPFKRLASQIIGRARIVEI